MTISLRSQEMAHAKVEAFKTWMPILANAATVVAMIIAARQFYVSSTNLNVATEQFQIAVKQSETASKQFELNVREQRYVNTAPFLKEGRDLEQRYQDGTAGARDIITFYYKIFSMHKDNLLVPEQATPLIQSLEEEISADPRVKQYWSNENHKRYSDEFATKLDNLIKKGADK
jgi:hypothetical protein